MGEVDIINDINTMLYMMMLIRPCQLSPPERSEGGIYWEGYDFFVPKKPIKCEANVTKKNNLIKKIFS